MKILSIITLILFMTPAMAGSPLYQKSQGYGNSGGYEQSGGYGSSGGYEKSGGYESIQGVDITPETFKSNVYRNANRKNIKNFRNQAEKVGRTKGDYIRSRHQKNSLVNNINRELTMQGGTRDR